MDRYLNNVFVAMGKEDMETLIRLSCKLYNIMEEEVMNFAEKIIKFLRKSWAYILLIIVLLVVQALCDLSLPGYTSDIVNVEYSKEVLKRILREGYF